MDEISVWLDLHGNMTVDYGKQTENPTTFNTAYLFLKDKSGELDFSIEYHFNKRAWAKYNTNNKTWRTLENDHNPKFSLDERISLAAAAHRYNWREMLDKIPIFTKDISHYRPDVFCFVLMCKFPLLRPFCWLFIALPALISCSGLGSSGPQLVFIKCYGAKMSFLWKLCTYVINENSSKTNWRFVFNEYYKNISHPTRQLAKKIWPSKS